MSAPSSCAMAAVPTPRALRPNSCRRVVSNSFSRSGFTAWGVDLARKSGLTLVGRARGERFVVLSGEDRVVFDNVPGGKS